MNKIAEGGYGVVYKISQTLVKKEFKNVDDNFQSVIREISALQVLNNLDGLITLHEIKYDINMTPTIYLPYYPSTLETVGFVEEKEIKDMMFQLLNGLQEMINRDIYHRDLKRGNILYDEKTKKLVIIDFGLSRYASIDNSDISKRLPNSNNVNDEKWTDQVQTLWYRAPELLLGITQKGYNIEIDIWSIGVIMAELFLNNYLFPSDSQYDAIRRIFELFGKPSVEEWPNIVNYENYSVLPQFERKKLNTVIPNASDFALDLIEGMCQMNPEKRLNINEALHHPFFGDRKPKETFKGPLERAQLMDITYFGNIEFITWQSDLTEQMRKVLLNWLLEVINKYKLKYATYFLGILLLDQYLKNNQVLRTNLQLIGLVCIYIASCVHEIYPLDLYFIEDALSLLTNTIYKSIKEVSKLLNYNMYLATEWNYLIAYFKHCSVFLELTHREILDVIRNAIELLKGSLMLAGHRTFSKQKLAASAIILSLRYNNIEIPVKMLKDLEKHFQNVKRFVIHNPKYSYIQADIFHDDKIF